MGVEKIIEVVQSVERTLSIIELLSEHNEGLGITDISVGVKLHKSTVHRLLATLIYKGYHSIGCTHCTVPGEDRSGRWNNNPKTECGLHL